MAIEVKVPAIGESITEGTLNRWFKKDGEAVKTDEPLYELETEKATTEVAAPAGGTLHITVPEGQTVPIGAVVGRIEAGAPAAAPGRDGGEKAPRGDQKRTEAPQPAASASVERKDQKPGTTAAADVVLSPSARRLAEEQGIEVEQLAGTGRGGRVTKEDVLTLLEKQKTAPPSSPRKEEAARPLQPALEAPPVLPKPSAPSGEAPGRETRQRMTAIRQRIADRLVAAKNTAAILTTFNEADMSAVMTMRSTYKDKFKEKHGINLGFMSFFVKAAVEALRAFPVVNGRIDDTDVVYQNFYDIGVAVSTEKGLMVPVVRNADQLGFAQIERAIADMAQKARQGKITVNDLQGGTFTITNGGIFGSLVSTPILNAPQSAILGMHAIQKRPVAVNDQVVIRPMMYLALSYDHRLIDGREAVQFLVRIKECVESPERLLLEI
ncbi:MAG: 2-oxoglutarate dehydrogenase complex dihydrolipoyllysine-residue succinyltransferase [Planctomycetes bacterium]|nr:2-oxoglutarate dehydrogenase complex dihydrolipoyllysine-residue succinyltransferase [Planctomycetota bacterium]